MHLMRWKPVALLAFSLSFFWPHTSRALCAPCLSPGTGPVGTVVLITNGVFGATRGSVSFNGTSAAITSWSNTFIVTTVPVGAMTGNVVVTTSSGPLSGVSFTVTTGSPTTGFGFRRAITIDHTKVPNTDQLNFPLLISGTYSYLATTANGGSVASASGFDIVFTSDAAGATALPFERESYSPTNGQVNIWVQVPIVSHTADTVIYMFYGNSAVVNDQSIYGTVWDTNYITVYHLGDNAASTTVLNSTLNYAPGTANANTNAKASTGEIDGALNFNGTSDYIGVPQNGNFNLHASPFTISGWIRDDSTAATLNTKHRAVSWYDGTKNMQLGFGSAGGNVNRITYMFLGTSTASAITASTGNLSTGFHYVAGTFDGISTTHIYVDGANVGGGTWDGSVTAYTADSTTLYLGQLGGAGFYINGQLDEMRISNVARSADWTLTEYRNQSSPSTFYSIGSAPGNGISYIQSQTNAQAGGNNIATFSVQPAAGDTVIAGLVCYGPSNCTINSVSDNFGNTYTKIGPTASYGGPTKNITNVALYCASGISTGANFAVNAALSNTGGDSNLYIAEYSGAACNVDQGASGSETAGSNTTLLQTSSVTTTNASDLLVAVGGSSTGGAATAGSGYSLRQNGNSGVAEYGGFEDKIVTASGSYNASMTVASNTTYWAMVMVALKGSSSGGVAPTVTSFSPTSGPIGTSVTITGTNLAGATAVKFNGTAVTSFTVNSSTQITATVPNNATTGPISVTTPSGTGTSSSNFTVTASPAPSITSLSAVGGSGGSSLTISGSFGALQGTVLFQNTDIGGNTSATITTWTSTSILIQVPSTLPIGLYNVQVVNSGGSSNTKPFWITGAGCPATW